MFSVLIANIWKGFQKYNILQIFISECIHDKTNYSHLL